MKPFLLGLLSLFALTSVVILSSCEEDKCKALVCAYDGICNEDGSCTCVSGYEGERCETITRNKFKGGWTVTEDGTLSNPAIYAVSVEDGNEIDEVLIRNFNNKYNGQVTAKVKADTIYISNQEMVIGEEVFVVEGKGYTGPESFYGKHGKIVLIYTVTNPDQTVNNYGMGTAGNPSIWTK